MKITLEQVELLRKRVHCDYQLAEKALRKSRGNIDDAVLYLKKRKKGKFHLVFVEVEDIFHKLLSYHLIICNRGKNIFRFPIFILIFIVWVFNFQIYFLILIAILAAFSSLSFEIIDKKAKDVQEVKLNKKESENDKKYEKTRREENQEEDHQKEKNFDETKYEYTQETKQQNKQQNEDKPIGKHSNRKKSVNLDDDFNEIIIE